MDEIEKQLLRLAERVIIRFREVPEFDEGDALLFVKDSKEVHGFKDDQLIPTKSERLVALYAMKEVAMSVAFQSAHYFKFTDGEESIDKTKVAHNYRQLAKEYLTEYNMEKAKSTGSMFRIVGRADRP